MANIKYFEVQMPNIVFEGTSLGGLEIVASKSGRGAVSRAIARKSRARSDRHQYIARAMTELNNNHGGAEKYAIEKISEPRKERISQQQSNEPRYRQGELF